MQYAADWILIIGDFKLSETVVVSWLIMAALSIASYFLTRNLKKVPTSKVQIFLEFAVMALVNLVTNTMGEKTVKRMPNMIPYIGSLFLFFACSNLIGLLGFRSPTPDIDTTLAWALITFFMIYYAGVKASGLSYFKGLLEPLPLLLPLNIIGEIARPISLTFRPFGNILGGSVIMSLVYQLLGWISTFIPAVGTIPFFQLVIPVPLHLYFDLFAGILQAFIFIMLTMVFVGNAASAAE
jgi:F-type H+-transporting ATPase subunit a